MELGRRWLGIGGKGITVLLLVVVVVAVRDSPRWDIGGDLGNTKTSVVQSSGKSPRNDDRREAGAEDVNDDRVDTEVDKGNCVSSSTEERRDWGLDTTTFAWAME